LAGNWGLQALKVDGVYLVGKIKAGNGRVGAFFKGEKSKAEKIKRIRFPNGGTKKDKRLCLLQ